jgi:DNA-binding beta-propeller fold protein YncE
MKLELRTFLVNLILAGALAGTAAAQGFPNVAHPQAGALLSGLLAPTQGRTAIIAFHNGVLYSVPEVPSSFGLSDYQVRSWDISDPANPQVLETLGVTRQPINAHGYLNEGPLLVLGDGDWNFAATATYGVNTRTTWPDMPGGVDGGPGDRGRLYHPFHIGPTWWSYGEISGNAVLSRLGGPLNSNQPIASWDHLGMTGVVGHPFLLGNLLIFAADQSRTGIATYDISDPSDPQLLDVLDSGGPGGYWPELWGGDGHLYVVWPYNNGGRGFRVVDVTDPSDIRWVIDKPLDGDEPMYAQFQDEFAFLADHKIDMRTMDVVLSLDSANAVRTSDGGTGIDTSQFALPLGNLLVTGGSGPNQGMAIWVHDTEPDTRGPEVGFHIPRNGQTNYPLDLPISLLIHETLETATLVNGTTFLVRPLGGNPIAGTLVFSFNDTLTFTPDAPLLPETTYEVVLPAGGIEDAAGNATTGYSFTFSTGDVVGGNEAPQITAFTGTAQVLEPGDEATFTVVANDPEGGALDYRFDAGDGRVKEDWNASAVVAFTYTQPGHYQVRVQVRDAEGSIATSSVPLTVVAPLVGLRPTQSSQIAIDGTGRAWSVNPDIDTVTVVDVATLEVEREVPACDDPRSVAIDSDGNAWVACHGDDRVVLLAAADGAVLAQIDTGYGSAPFGIALSPDGQTAWVSLYGSGALLRIDVANRASTGSVALGATARAVAVSGDGASVYVSRFLSPLNHGEVWEVDTATLTLARTLRLPKLGGAENADGASAGRGVPNYLAGLAVSPDGESLWVAANKANIERGTLFGAPLDHDNTVRNLVARIDLASGLVDRSIDIDNSDSASALTFSPRGDYLFVTLQGNNELVVFDALTLGESAGLGGMVTRLQAGLAAQGVAVDAATGRILVNNFMGRSVTAFNATPLLDAGGIDLVASEIDTVATETLSVEVLAGKRIFYNAADVRMASEGYISCASCHVDGGADGRVWDFTQRGEGLRNTIDLRGRAGMGHGNVHWSGNFDEIQDFENDMRNGFGGLGFLDPNDFAATSDPLGAPKAGLSAELDALAAYVASLGEEELPRSPHRAPDGNLTVEAGLGLDVFAAAGCATCHSGVSFTDSTSPAALLHDVGTLRSTSGQRLGAPLAGIDTPTLLGVWDSAPYFHDGSAPSLEAVFEVAGGDLIEAETGSVTGGTIEAGASNILANFDNTVTGGGLVNLGYLGLVTLSGVDADGGGVGAIEFRYSGSGGMAFVRVNGAETLIALDGTGNAPAWRTTHWQTARVEGVVLAAGDDNEVEIGMVGGSVAIDHVVVSTADDLAAAAAHRVVQGLGDDDRDSLLALLRQLDGGPLDAPEPPVDDLAPLSDEFGAAASLADWQRNYIAEGWGAAADKLEVWDIDTSRAGHMRLMPASSTWFHDYAGALAYKEVTGDFVATIRIEVGRRNGLPGRPQAEYSWAGLLVRAPRGLDAAAPVPDPGSGTVLPWPPPPFGAPDHYTTNWQPGTENYIYLASGYATDAINPDTNVWQVEAKTTTDSVSTFYSTAAGSPTGVNAVTLQIARVGDTFLLLRRHGDGPWLIENRYERSDLPATLQIGLTAYGDWAFAGTLNEFHHNRTAAVGLGNPDIVADIDYFRLQRPDDELTATDLQAVPVTGQYGPLRDLADTALGNVLGEAANAPWAPATATPAPTNTHTHTPTRTPTPTPTATATATPEASICPQQPRPDCLSADRARLDQREGADRRRSFAWQWQGTGAFADFGNPMIPGGVLRVCTWVDGEPAAAAEVPTGGQCAGRDCWKPMGTNGFQRRDRDGATAGIEKIQLRERNGIAKLAVKARGQGVQNPLPITGAATVTIQLDRGDAGPCWESVFVPPALRTEADRYLARVR